MNSDLIYFHVSMHIPISPYFYRYAVFRYLFTFKLWPFINCVCFANCAILIPQICWL